MQQQQQQQQKRKPYGQAFNIVSSTFTSSSPLSSSTNHNYHLDQQNTNTSNNSIAFNSYNNTNEESVELLINDINILSGLWNHFPFIYKIGDTQSGNNGPILLQQVCKERGWKEFSHYDIDSYGNPLQAWNLHWVTGKLSSRNIYSWQVSNHSNLYSTGKNYSFTMKNGCSRYLKRLQNSFGSAFDFGPLTFNLPSDYARLCSEHSKRKKAFLSKLFTWEFEMSIQEKNNNNKNCILDDPPKDIIRPIWICKPVGKSRGRGIIIFDSPEKLNYLKQCVVQEYITRPYLIGGYKWDLRLYVCIVCRAPLVIYTYTEGLVRFSTYKFNLNHLSNVFSHLTNTSVNRESPEYMEVKAEIGKGCKWPLKKLRSFWKAHDIDDWYLWQRIWKVIILTIIADTSNICKSESIGHHFDLLGFDIIIDENMKPYLLEVNTNPALSLDCEVDEIVKRAMLHDLFDLLGLPDANHFNPQQERYNPTGCHMEDLGFSQNSRNIPKLSVLEDAERRSSTSSLSRSSCSSLTLDNNLNNIKSSKKKNLAPKKCSTINNNKDNNNNLGVSYLNGAKNAYNEILGFIFKPKCINRVISGDNNDFLSELFPDKNINEPSRLLDITFNNLAFIQSNFCYNSFSFAGPRFTHYRPNPYFQTIGCPGQMQIYPPVPVKIPIKKRQCRVRYPKNYLDKWRTGLIYKIRDWNKSPHYNTYNNLSDAYCPEQVGGWIRTYPFDITTYNLSMNLKNFDIRSAIQHVNNYMKIAREISSTNNPKIPKQVQFINSESSFTDFHLDSLLSKRLQLNTKVWHPELNSTYSSTETSASAETSELLKYFMP